MQDLPREIPLQYKFLLVEKSAEFRDVLSDLIRRENLGEPVAVDNLEDAEERIRIEGFDVICLGDFSDEARVSGLISAFRGSETGDRLVLLAAEEPEKIPESLSREADCVLLKNLDAKEHIAQGLERLLVRTGSGLMVVDADRDRLKRTRDQLLNFGFRRVFECRSGFEALLKHPALGTDLIVLQEEVGGISVRDFLKEIRDQDKGVRIVVLLRDSGGRLLGDLVRLGVNDYIPGDASDDVLADVVYRQLCIRRDDAVRTRLREELETRDRRTRIELRLAAGIQKQIVPSEPPEFPGYRFAVGHLPSHEIGGDVFGFYPFEEQQMGVLFADISGHGIPAALLSIAFKIYADIVLSEFREPRDVLANLGSHLHHIYPPESFASTFYLLLQPDGKVAYGKASQEPALLMRRDGRIEELEGEGLVLGLFADEGESGVSVEPVTLSLKPGERIILYTDGITEAREPYGEEYGIQRFREALSACADRSPEEICRVIPAVLSRFVKKVTFDDDMTLVVIEKQ